MAYFAEIKNNFVLRTIKVDNAVIENKPFPESEAIGIAFCKSIYGSDTEWLQTSYNHNFRGVYGGPGTKYDPDTDEFINLEIQSL